MKAKQLIDGRALIIIDNGKINIENCKKVHAHSGAGACWAAAKLGLAGRLLAYCIAGHHAGLPDFAGGITPNGALQQRLGEDGKVLAELALAAWIARHEAGWLAC